MKKITLLLLLFSSLTFSQNFSGTIYDDEAPVSGVKIMNISAKSITSSDGNGKFEIHAKINDTLVFSSLFHHTKKTVLTSSNFNAPQVFELKKLLNELDEVMLEGAKDAPLDAKKISQTFQKQFKSDVENNAHLYRRANRETGPLDILEIGRRVAKLFKGDGSKKEKEVQRSITSDDLNLLFETDKVFNDTFLLLNLNITKDYKQLFFAYCETKGLSTLLLNNKQHFYLMDELLVLSEEFRKLLAESQKSID